MWTLWAVRRQKEWGENINESTIPSLARQVLFHSDNPLIHVSPPHAWQPLPFLLGAVIALTPMADPKHQSSRKADWGKHFYLGQFPIMLPPILQHFFTGEIGFALLYQWLLVYLLSSSPLSKYNGKERCTLYQPLLEF